MIQNRPEPLSRKSTYLIQSKSGVFYFRWNVFVNGTHHQPRVSLRTRDYLEALAIASTLGKNLRLVSKPSVQQVKAVYRDYFQSEVKLHIKIKDLNIDELLTDLSPKSKREYLSCWRSFILSLDCDDLCVTDVLETHIEGWKACQTCSPITLKKKLRLLSSCFQKAGIPNEAIWFQLKIKKRSGEGRRALTSMEIVNVFEATRRYKSSQDQWKFYLPRLALLTGCRLNELAQLRVSDVVLGQDATLSINAKRNDQRTKNEASVRKIPLTEVALELILSLILHKSQDRRLFETLPYSELNGYAGKPSKYFSSLIKKELYLTGVSFHSFRHSAVTHLFNSGVREELIGQLMGHSIGRTTSGKVYMSGFTDELRLDAMRHLSDLYLSICQSTTKAGIK